MSRTMWWMLYGLTMAVLITAIIMILVKRPSEEQRALEDYYHGNKLYELGHYDEAIAKYKLAIIYDPHLVKAYYNLALVLEERSYSEAAEAWEKYLEVVKKEGVEKEAWDDIGVAREHLAYCYYNLGMEAESDREAREYLKRYIDMAEGMPGHEGFIADARERLSELE